MRCRTGWKCFVTLWYSLSRCAAAAAGARVSAILRAADMVLRHSWLLQSPVLGGRWRSCPLTSQLETGIVLSTHCSTPAVGASGTTRYARMCSARLRAATSRRSSTFTSVKTWEIWGRYGGDKGEIWGS